MVVYELNCKKCGYNLCFGKGVLMSFNQTNRELLKRMKNGELGENFKKIANENPDARVSHSRELFRCTKCGELSGGMVIVLRGADNRVLAEEEHFCKGCGSKMEALEGIENSREYELSCPRCKKAFDGLQLRVKVLVD